jgi:hypothetical protein
MIAISFAQSPRRAKMADEETVIKAKEMGWIPREQYHGADKDFVDAPEFVSRGEKLMPILKANNRKLNTTVKQQGIQIQNLSTQLTEAQRAIAEFSKQNAQSNLDRLKQRRQSLLAAKTAARQADDAAGETQAEEDLRQLDTDIQEATRAVGSAKSTSSPPTRQVPNPQADPAYQSFLADNPWYGQDKNKTRYADGVAADLRRDPANEGLLGEAFYEKVVEEVQSQFPTARRTSKVESGGNGSSNGGGSDRGGSGKSYSDLPSDARQVCDKQANNPRMVGEGKTFKNAEAYRQHYAEQYFRGE